MAGPIRQPIDLDGFDRYLRNNVPEIKTPVEVKQVSCITRDHSRQDG